MNKLALIFITCVSCMWPLTVVASGAMAGDNNAEYAQIADHMPKIAVVPGGLKIEVMSGNSEPFTVYSITGQVIKNFIVASGAETVELPQGCYIVKCNHWSKKVVVK